MSWFSHLHFKFKSLFWALSAWSSRNCFCFKPTNRIDRRCTCFSVYRSRVSAWLAQLVRASIRWVEDYEFNSWVDDIFHLPVFMWHTKWNVTGKSPKCFIMYKGHSQGHNMPFFRVNRKGDVLNKHSKYEVYMLRSQSFGKKRKKKKRFPSESKKSVSIVHVVNPTLILPALSYIRSKERGQKKSGIYNW